MQMDVLDAFRGFAIEPRRIEVVDIRHVGVQEVEALERETHTVGEPISNLAIPDGRGIRRDAGVLDEGPWAEVAKPDAAEYRVLRLRGDRTRYDTVERSGDVVAPGIVVG